MNPWCSPSNLIGLAMAGQKIANVGNGAPTHVGAGPVK